MPSPKHFLQFKDLGRDELEYLFGRTRWIKQQFKAYRPHHPLFDRTLVMIFEKQSTRTRLSFEAAMWRLGGAVISASDMKSSSAAKGETLADTAKVVSSYADLLVLRHFWDGAARLAAEHAAVPVINAGDGGHEHPTQTLCDLYTLWKEKGHIDDLEVVLCGDLRYSRTIHSFCYALARFGANIVTMPYPGFELPDYVLHRLKRDFGIQAAAASVADLPGIAGSSNAAAYLTASKPHQLALFTNLTNIEVNRIDAIYMTRAQRERHSGESTANYPRLGRNTLGAAAAKDARIMHPLPRVDEIDYDVDDDPRSVYFRQAELGVPMRMALMAFLLGKIQLRSAPPPILSVHPGIEAGAGLRCRNERCITNNEGVRYLVRDFRLREAEVPPQLSCAYCEREIEARFVGHVQSRVFHRYNAAEARHIKSDNRVYFESEAQAQAAGFQPPAT